MKKVAVPTTTTTTIEIRGKHEIAIKIEVFSKSNIIII